MPILYIHGVNVRSRDGFNDIKLYLRRLVAPAISRDPGGVLIEDVFWGDLGVRFAWEGVSRPRSRLLGQGAEQAAGENALMRALTYSTFDSLSKLPTGAVPSAATGGLIGGGSSAAWGDAVDPGGWSEDELSDFLASVILCTALDADRRAELILATDAVAHDSAVRERVLGLPSAERQVEALITEAAARVPASGGLLAAGAVGDWFAGVRDRASETVRRGLGLPAYGASVVVAELRRPLHELVSMFIGDVCQYLILRGTATQPGRIPGLLLDKLKSAAKNKQAREGESLVVLSHSMGGQIVYDTVTRYLPAGPDLAGIRIDFWCATASQVGFFEEAKFFIASSPQHKTGEPVPFPGGHLGVWWNVWDPNDILSFTARDIFLGVDDESYSSGMTMVNAHSGYLQRPSFYRRFAEKLRQAAKRGWRTV
jgi:hypothetical protein